MSTHAVGKKYMLGVTLWILTVQFYITEYLAASSFQPRYSYKYNVISDLGATLCSNVHLLGITWNVCSPLHTLMNFSFILNGLLTITGCWLLSKYFPSRSSVRTALTLISIGSLGAIGVGFFPENVQPVLHVASAILILLLPNIGLIFLGYGLRKAGKSKKLSYLTLILGIIGVFGFMLIPLGAQPWIGPGVVERMAAYPLNIWTVMIGLLLHPLSLWRNKLP